jgi:uncharacterized integral membrane protein (TIGR02327 family)
MDVWSSSMTQVGVQGLIFITVSILCIAISGWALQSFKFDLFVKQPKGPQAKALHIILSIVIGYQLAGFIMDYIEWSSALKWMM